MQNYVYLAMEGKLCVAYGLEPSKDCPMDPHAMVGPECPCNLWRKVPAENWYFSPASDEFKSGKPECSRVKPADLKDFGYYHKLGKCKTCYAKAHEMGKADTNKLGLLVPLPKGATDCMTVEA